MTSKVVIAEGGFSILKRQIPYNGSLLYAALRRAYPEGKWNDDWFRHLPYPPSYWEDLENQRKFMRNIAEKYGFHNQRDWKRVSSSLIVQHGGRVNRMKKSCKSIGSTAIVQKFNFSSTERCVSRIQLEL